MDVQPDFKELLELFNANQVEYLIVGGYALAFPGAPRTTGAIYLFVNISQDNAQRILKSLKSFGFGDVGLSEGDFAKPDNVIQLGHPPVRIDIMTSLSGVSWDEAYETREAGQY